MAPTLPAILSTYNLLYRVAKRHDAYDRTLLQPYYITPVVNGGVSLSWRSDWAQLWVTIGPGGAYRYYWEDRHDAATFDEQADVTIEAILEQIEKTLQSRRE